MPLSMHRKMRTHAARRHRARGQRTGPGSWRPSLFTTPSTRSLRQAEPESSQQNIEEDMTRAGKHALPEHLRRAQESSRSVSCGAVATETGVSDSVTGPGQGALKGAPQVVEGPRYDHVVVEAHQRGHTQHPDADT